MKPPHEGDGFWIPSELRGGSLARLQPADGALPFGQAWLVDNQPIGLESKAFLCNLGCLPAFNLRGDLKELVAGVSDVVHEQFNLHGIWIIINKTDDNELLG